MFLIELYQKGDLIFKFLNKVALLYVVLLLAASVVHAGAVINYNGQGIWSWRTIREWTNNSASRKYTVTHIQRRVNRGDATMTVKIMKKNWVGASAVSQSVFRNDTSGKFSAYLGKGTYFLRFESGQAVKKFNVQGNVAY